MNAAIARGVATALFAGLLAAGCSADSSGKRSASASTRAGAAKTDDSAAGTVELKGPTYHPGPVSSVGSVSGTVTLDGTPPSATVPVTKDQPTCGTTAEAPVVSTVKGLTNSVVWVANIASGKPLPIEKRVSISSEKCILDPRVQAVTVGTTVNVFNDDKLLHKLVFVRAGTHDTLTVMPFFNVGQVVASERLATEPGIVEIRCALHPWTHGYIAVFDHPYFAVTQDDGNFKIDSLPPGSYKLMVWHEGAEKPVEQQVQVGANGIAKAQIAIKAGTSSSAP